jgi:hypothetical protein
MSTVLLMCWLYNFVLIVEGHGSKLNFVGLVLGSVAIVGRWTLMARGEPSFENRKLLRRLGVFLVGGFICPKCGDARVKLGGWQLLFTCPGCRRFFFEAERTLSVKKMWGLVWRWKR